MKDLFGQAILDYQTNNQPENITTETNISEADEMETSWLFRSHDQMPVIEKKALELSRGSVLDIGCGAGSHALYLQNEKNLDVTAIDISPKAVEACALRGVKHVEASDFMDVYQQFDTILLLMNGTGICGKLANLPRFLQKLKSLLQPNGQILIDSSDIVYMFDQDDDGGHWIDSGSYYGELEFTIFYKG
ncbi:MAG: class I SAM-dependent methyltransferase, partial [Proteobacteria bacterium]